MPSNIGYISQPSCPVKIIISSVSFNKKVLAPPTLSLPKIKPQPKREPIEEVEPKYIPSPFAAKAKRLEVYEPILEKSFKEQIEETKEREDWALADDEEEDDERNGFGGFLW